MNEAIIHLHELELDKCKMDQEATEYWSVSNLMWQFTYSYTMTEYGEYEGRTWLSSPVAYPSTVGHEMHSPAPIYPDISPAYIVTTQIPRGPRPYGSIGKELGHTWKYDEPPPQHKTYFYLWIWYEREGVESSIT
jgi:hypothetical protein